MIAALYVQTGGCYFGLPDVDPWDEARDARLYAGPWPVVAHPPCERWGRYWSGGPSARVRRAKGDDGGCFKAALASVREFGGVLEHPEASHAWAAFGLKAPPRDGGWIRADHHGGWTCCVEQGHYGHRARKATWLYVNGTHRPDLKWGKSEAKHSWGESKRREKERERWPSRRESRTGTAQLLSHKERAATPIPFRDLLLSLARGC